MKIARMLQLLFWVLFMQVFQVSFAASNETDRLSLVAFKAQISEDPLGVLKSWNDSSHFCEWFGVACGKRHQRVTMLNLQSSQLVGSLTPQLGNLSFLRVLNLQNNSFTGVISQELGNLRRLQMLSLENNTFRGRIPVNISRCSYLQYLDVGGNNLTGTIPSEFESLSKLQVLYVYNNNLLGKIPPFLGNLSSLELISGTWNFLFGDIPESLGNLKKLKYLFLGGNELTGTVPSSLYNHSSITTFELVFNKLQGTLPPDLGNTLPNVDRFNIASNNFSGSIPVTISNASKIILLGLSRNNFNGKVPNLAGTTRLRCVLLSNNSLGDGDENDLDFLSYLVNCTNLEAIAITINNFGGILPEYLGNFSTKLRGIYFGSNRIHGTIPRGLGNLIGLTVLGLEDNHFTGAIPSSIGKLGNLGRLTLNHNNFSGTIPPALGNITSLKFLSLTRNNLQGSIPSSLGNYQTLLHMDLSRNNLNGTIPGEVMSITSLAISLILSSNQLSGSIPTEVGKLVNVGYVGLSNNMLSGEIPMTIGRCESLETLYLQRNFLQGRIPGSMSSLRAIQVLDLSQNSLSGEIPEFLGSFTSLQNLNLSYNGFEGQVTTKGVFKNASAISVAGNPKLCGGVSELNLPPCLVKEPKQKKTSASSLKVIMPVVSGIILLFLMFSFIFVRIWKRKQKPNSAAVQASIGFFWQVSFGDLLKATDGFSLDNRVGIGRFGSVYRGILENGGTVAVKVLNLHVRGASKSFLAECEALRHIRHRNLVGVVTTCVSFDFQGSEFKALVYDFMANGSLEELLHPAQGMDESLHRQKKLNLLQRLNAAIDVASALSYLHLHCQPAIVHCDLKPSNVLLDEYMVARVGDFGLAKLIKDSTQVAASSHMSSLVVRGTMGYVAPEYGMGGEVSTQGDVYSFGVLLLELFTGMRPTDELFADGLNLHNYVKSALSEPDSVAKIIDPVLMQEFGDGSSDSWQGNMRMEAVMKECVTAILEIGLACSAELPRQRIHVRHAEDELRSIRDNSFEWTKAETNCLHANDSTKSSMNKINNFSFELFSR